MPPRKNPRVSSSFLERVGPRIKHWYCYLCIISVTAGKNNQPGFQEGKKEEKKDMSTAILAKKKSRNAFLVDDAVNDDHSVVALSKEKMLELDIYQVSLKNPPHLGVAAP